jgi:hypothetical protein
MGFVVRKAALGQIFFEYLGSLATHFTLIIIHHPSSPGLVQ